MRIVITGANGYVGPSVVRRLLAQHQVLAVDCLRYGPPQFSKDELSRMVWSDCDIREGRRVEEVVTRFRPQAVIHLAAIHFIPECEKHPDLAVSTNVTGTVNLLHCIPAGCRFVFASSASVYQPKETPHVEGADPARPMDVYGLTKLMGEELTTYFAGRRQFQAVLVRLFNVIGPGETNPHVVPEIIRQLKMGRRTLKLGNIFPRRDYVDVEDVAAGFIAAALTDLPPDRRVVAVNLGTGRSVSVQEIVDHLSKIIGEKITIESDAIKTRSVDRPNLCADNALFRRIFGWSPRFSVEESLRRTWQDPSLHERLDLPPS